ncbi:TPA: phosphohistidine phosphatase [Enterobacter kobei]
MGELWNKISSYNIFNNLLPGALYVYFIERSSHVVLNSGEIVKDVILYYFIGLVIGRLGSLIFEPLIIWVRLVRFESYDKYVAACKVDGKIELLQEIANMYRTLCIVFIAIIVSLFIITHFTGVTYFFGIYIYAAMFILFSISYIKQTRYIVKRVKAAITP